MTDTTLADKLEALAPALDNLRNYQRQLDMDGCHVGVSRQALDEVLDAVERALRERDQAVEALREIAALDGEINPSNYDHDDACYLNRQFCYAGTSANQTLASIEGAGDE